METGRLLGIWVRKDVRRGIAGFPLLVDVVLVFKHYGDWNATS